MRNFQLLEDDCDDQVQLMKNMQQMIDQICHYESIKVDKEFRKIFRVNQTLEEPRESLFRLAKKK